METVGQILRNKRQKLELLLRRVSVYVDIDQAILSKKIYLKSQSVKN